MNKLVFWSLTFLAFSAIIYAVSGTLAPFIIAFIFAYLLFYLDFNYLIYTFYALTEVSSTLSRFS
jgi:hypothetical protein